jgi:integrase
MRCDAKFPIGCRPLGERAREAMRLRHLPPRTQEAVRAQHRAVFDKGAGWVELPHVLDRKLPAEGRLCPWQWVFPATGAYVDSGSGQGRRHHLHETVVHRAASDAVRGPGISQRATCPTFRHSFPMRLLEDGTDTGYAPLVLDMVGG